MLQYSQQGGHNMKPNEIIKEIMRARGYSNKSLADKLGKSTASAVSNPLSRENGMRIDYIFSNKPIKMKYHNIVFNGINGDIISDHFGIIAEE